MSKKKDESLPLAASIMDSLDVVRHVTEAAEGQREDLIRRGWTREQADAVVMPWVRTLMESAEEFTKNTAAVTATAKPKSMKSTVVDFFWALAGVMGGLVIVVLAVSAIVRGLQWLFE